MAIKEDPVLVAAVTQATGSIDDNTINGGAKTISPLTLPKYQITESQLNAITFESNLIVNGVVNKDYGEYECVARNELGFDQSTVKLNHTSKPDSPLALRAINVTSDSVTLRWIPGFDGGLPQTFQLRYKRVSGGSNGGDGATPTPTPDSDSVYLYSDVAPFNTTEFRVKNLESNAEYQFSIRALNSLGESDFTADIVKAKTLKG